MHKTFILFLKVTFLIFLLNLTTEQGFSQGCHNCIAQNPGVTQTIPDSSDWQIISPAMKGGDYTVCQVEQGILYTWTTCLSSGFNTQLTLYQGTGCSGNYLAYNDNACGGHKSTIIWRATFSGLVTALVSKHHCHTTTSSEVVSLSWKSESSGCNSPIQLCSVLSTYPAKTGQNTLINPSSNPDWNCLHHANQLNVSNQTWYYFKITQAGDIDLQITSSPQVNIDGIVWGPFDSLSQTCQSTEHNPEACDRSTFNVSLNFHNAVANKYYLIMVSNHPNQATNLSFSFQNSTADIELCQPVLSYLPTCEGSTFHLYATSGEPNAHYHWTGPNGFNSLLQNPIRTNVTNLLHSGIYSCYISTSYGNSATENIIVDFLPIPATSLMYHN